MKGPKTTPKRSALRTISPRTEEILAKLHEGGARLTKTRKALVELMAGATQPLSATQIIGTLQGRAIRVNKTTAYRELEFLQAAGVIRELDLLDGKKRYELLQGTGHHHHFVCTNCRSVHCVDIHCGVGEIEAAVAAKYNVTVQSHVLEFFGLCKNCRH